MKLYQDESLLVREAEQSDKAILLQFEQELIETERPMDPTIRSGSIHYHDMDALIQDPDTCFLVAEKDGQVVACGYARPRTARHYLDHPTYAYLGFMFTAVPFRGQGINQRIIENLKHWSVQRGLTEFRLTVYETNAPAIRAYEKIGFEKHLIEMRFREG